MSDDDDELRDAFVMDGDFKEAFLKLDGSGVDELLDALMRANIEVTRLSKEELVRNGPDDLPPLCVWYLDDGQSIPIPVGTISDQMQADPPGVLGGCLAAIRKHFGKSPKLAILGYEAWMHKGLNGEDADPDKPPGEAVILIIATKRRSLHAIIQFHYEGGLQWDELTVADIPTEELPQYGAMPMALYAAFMTVEAN